MTSALPWNDARCATRDVRLRAGRGVRVLQQPADPGNAHLRVDIRGEAGQLVTGLEVDPAAERADRSSDRHDAADDRAGGRVRVVGAGVLPTDRRGLPG